MFDRILAFVALGLALAFGLDASASTAHFARLAPYMTDEPEMLAKLMGIVLALTPQAVGWMSGALAVLIVIRPAAFWDHLIPLGLWALLGWGIGSAFSEAVAARAQCLNGSSFGFGCTLEGPVIRQLLYGLLSCLGALISGLTVLSAVFSKESGAEARAQP